MSTPEERKDVFAWFGAASYYSQCVETELWIARILLGREENPGLDDDIWARIENAPRTMGRLLCLIHKRIDLREEEREILTTCVEKRNWLAHSYWEERSHLLATAEGCVQAVEELETLCALFKSGNDKATEVSNRLRIKEGIPENVIEYLQEEYTRRIKAGESHLTILEDQEKRIRQLSDS